jgi:hypothetical protein
MEKGLRVSIKYWTLAEEDFTGLAEFKAEIESAADLNVEREISDALGGGLFEFIVNVASDLSLHEIVKSYLEDAVKFGIGVFAREFVLAAKNLFDLNKKHRPEISEFRVTFKDFQITVYSTYERSLETVLEEVLAELFSQLARFDQAKDLLIESIHIPVFWHVENADPVEGFGDYHSFEIPAYRVRLTIDETIRDFKREQYFDLWGFRLRDLDVVYNVKTATLVFSKFYLEDEYWTLQSKALEAAKLLKT